MFLLTLDRVPPGCDELISRSGFSQEASVPMLSLAKMGRKRNDLEASSMSNDCDAAARALRSFLRSVESLPLLPVISILRTERRRALTLSSLYVHPDFLQAVTSGGWTQEHAVLARRARRASKRLAFELVSWRDRRLFARALEAAALAVLMRSAAQLAVPEPLIRRIESPWLRAVASVSVVTASLGAE